MEYDTPYNLVFMNEHQRTCHGILKMYTTNLERKFKRDPEKYRDIETLIKAGWHIHDTKNIQLYT